MDLKSMRRNQLQALCKKHNLPSNSTNSQMVESLTSLLQTLENLKPKGCLKGSGGMSDENTGSGQGGSKKVSFFLQQEVEYEEFSKNPVGKSSLEKRRSSRRRSIMAPEPETRSQEIGKGGGFESLKKVSDIPIRTTRSRFTGVLWSPIVEKKTKARKGMEGVCQNAEPAPDVRLQKEEELPRNPDGNSLLEKRRSSRRSSVAAQKPETRREEMEEGGSIDSPEKVSEIPGRTTRSRAVALGVLWSPLVGKKKKAGGRMKGMHQNTEPPPDVRLLGETEGDAKKVVKESSGKAPTTRYLRNRVVGVGGLPGILRPSRTQNRRSTHKAEDDEVAAPLSEEVASNPQKLGIDEVFGRKNLRKRPRVAVSAGDVSAGKNPCDEPIRRRSSRNLVESKTSLSESEELGANQAVHGIRSKTSIKETTEVSFPEPTPVRESGAVANKDIERVSGESATRSRRNILKSNGMERENSSTAAAGEAGDVNETALRKKSEKLVRNRASKQGDSTPSLPNTEAVMEPTRRSTRSYSMHNLVEDETSLSAHRKLGGIDEVFGWKNLRKRPRIAVSAGDVSAPDESVNINPYDEPKRRRSSRNLVKSKTYLSESKELGANQAVHGVRSKTSRKEATEVSFPKPKPAREAGVVAIKDIESVSGESATRSRRNILKSKGMELENSSTAAGEAGDVNETTLSKKSEKLVRNRASKQGDSTASLSNTEAIMEPTRRSTRSSSMHNLVEDKTSLSARGKLGDGDETVRKGNSGMQARTLRSRREAGSETEKVSQEQEVQKFSQKVTQPEEVPRRSRHNASKHIEPVQEISLPMGGRSADNDERNMSNKIRRQYRDQDLKGKGSEASVSDCRTVAESEDLEVPKELEETPRRSRRKVSRQESCAVALLMNVSDEKVETKRERKRGRSALEEGISVVETEIGDTGTQQKVFNIERRKKSRKIPAENEVVQKECFPDPSMSLLEDIPKDSDVKGEGSGRKTSNKKRSSQMHCRKSNRKIKIGGHHNQEDQNLLTGEQAGTSDSHEAKYTAGNLDSFPGPASGVAETDGINDVDEYNVSEVQQSPLVVHMQEVGNGNSLEGALQDVLGDVGLVSHFKENNSGLLKMANKGKKASLSQSVEESSETRETILGGLGFSNVEAGADMEETMEAASKGKSYVDEKDAILTAIDSTASTMKAYSSGNFVDALDNEDVKEGNEATIIRNPPLSCRHSEELLTTAVTEASPEIDLEEPDLIAGFHVASEKASQSDDLPIHSSDNQNSDPGEFPNPQVVFKNEMEIHGTALETLPNAQLAREECEVAKEFKETPTHASDSQLRGAVVKEIEETFASASLLVTEKEVETGGDKNDDENIEAEMGQSLPCKSPAFGLCSGDQVHEHGIGISSEDILETEQFVKNEMGIHEAALETMPNAQLTPEECEVVKEFKETPTHASDSQSRGAIVKEIEEAFASPSLSVTEKDGVETGGDKNDDEKIEAEMGQSLPWKSPAFGLCPGEQVQEPGIGISSEEILETEQSDPIHISVHGRNKCLFGKDYGDVEGNSEAFDGKCYEGNKNFILSPVGCIKSEEQRNALEMAIKHNEFSPSKLVEVSSEIRDGEPYVDNEGPIISEAGSNKSGKQTSDQEARFQVVDVRSTTYDSLADDSGAPVDAVLFEDGKKCFEASAQIDYEDLSKQADVLASRTGSHINDCSPIYTIHDPDSKAGGDFSGQRDSRNEMGSFLVDFVDMNPESAPKDKLNVILPETANTDTEVLNVKFDRSLEPVDDVADEIESAKSVEGEVSTESDDSVGKKEDCAPNNKFDGVVQLGEGFFPQRMNDINEELQDAGMAANLSLKTTDCLDSAPREVSIMPFENFASSENIENDLTWPDVILSDEQLVHRKNVEKSSAEEEPLNYEDFSPFLSILPLSEVQEGQDREREVREMELRLYCNVDAEVDEQEDTVTMLGVSNEEGRGAASTIPESLFEAAESTVKHTSLSASGSTQLMPVDDALECKEKSSWIDFNATQKHEEDYNRRTTRNSLTQDFSDC